jgi:hypothetical protein
MPGVRPPLLAREIGTLSAYKHHSLEKILKTGCLQLACFGRQIIEQDILQYCMWLRTGSREAGFPPSTPKLCATSCGLFPVGVEKGQAEPRQARVTGQPAEKQRLASDSSAQAKRSSLDQRQCMCRHPLELSMRLSCLVIGFFLVVFLYVGVGVDSLLPLSSILVAAIFCIMLAHVKLRL